MKNFTGGENLQTYAELYCSVEITGQVHGQLIFLSVINIFLSITAFLGNALILVVLHKDTSIHPPSKLLYRNLAISDLCVGITVEPLNVAHWTSVVNKRWDICYYTYLTAHFAALTLRSVSLITLTAISVDRLLALLLGFRYRQVVTLKRTCLIAIGGWNCVHCWFIYILSESSYSFIVQLYCFSFLFSYYNLCLHKNFHVSAS